MSVESAHDRWVVIGRDLRFIEEAFLSVDSGDVVVITKEGKQQYIPAKLKAACFESIQHRLPLASLLAKAWEALVENDHESLLRFFESPVQDLKSLCSQPARIMVVGEDDSCKKDLLGFLAGSQDVQASLGEHLTVRLIGSTPSSPNPSCCKLVFRADANPDQPRIVAPSHDLTEVGIRSSDGKGANISDCADDDQIVLPDAVINHLKSYGSGQPMVISGYQQLLEFVGKDLSQSCIEEGWVGAEDLASVVDHVQAVIPSNVLSAGLELVDGPSCNDSGWAASTAKRHADAVVFKFTSDPGEGWHAIQQTAAVFGEKAVFVVVDCRSKSENESSPISLERLRSEANARGLSNLFVTVLTTGDDDCLPGCGLVPGGDFGDGVSGCLPLESAIADWLLQFGISQASGLAKQVFAVMKQVEEKLEADRSLLCHEHASLEELRGIWSPQLARLQQEHEEALAAVHKELAAEKEILSRQAESFVRKVSELVPSLALEAPSHGVGVSGVMYDATRDSFARSIESHIRKGIEDQVNSWSTNTLMPAVETIVRNIQGKLNQRIDGHLIEIESVRSAIGSRGRVASQARAAVSANASKDRLEVLSSVPTVSTKLASYFGVTKSLLTVVSGHLFAFSGLIVVGTLCSVASIMSAWRSSGDDTEQAIRRVMGQEISQALLLHHQATAREIVNRALEPIYEVVKRHSEGFSAEIAAWVDSMEMAELLVKEGPSSVARRAAMIDQVLLQFQQLFSDLREDEFQLLKAAHKQLPTKASNQFSAKR